MFLKKIADKKRRRGKEGRRKFAAQKKTCGIKLRSKTDRNDSFRMKELIVWIKIDQGNNQNSLLLLIESDELLRKEQTKLKADEKPDIKREMNQKTTGQEEIRTKLVKGKVACVLNHSGQCLLELEIVFRLHQTRPTCAQTGRSVDWMRDTEADTEHNDNTPLGATFSKDLFSIIKKKRLAMKWNGKWEQQFVLHCRLDVVSKCGRTQLTLEEDDHDIQVRSRTPSLGKCQASITFPPFKHKNVAMWRVYWHESVEVVGNKQANEENGLLNWPWGVARERGTMVNRKRSKVIQRTRVKSWTSKCDRRVRENVWPAQRLIVKWRRRVTTELGNTRFNE